MSWYMPKPIPPMHSSNGYEHENNEKISNAGITANLFYCNHTQCNHVLSQAKRPKAIGMMGLIGVTSPPSTPYIQQSSGLCYNCFYEGCND